MGLACKVRKYLFELTQRLAHTEEETIGKDYKLAYGIIA